MRVNFTTPSHGKPGGGPHKSPRDGYLQQQLKLDLAHDFAFALGAGEDVAGAAVDGELTRRAFVRKRSTLEPELKLRSQDDFLVLLAVGQII